MPGNPSTKIFEVIKKTCLMSLKYGILSNSKLERRENDTTSKKIEEITIINANGLNVKLLSVEMKQRLGSI